MDFGDILNQWEEHQKSEARRQKESGKNTVSHKKANAPTPEEKALKKMHEGFDYNAERDRRINPMELWLRRYGTVDKDSLNEQEEARERYKSRSALVSMRCEARIDLHGLKQEEAWSRLNAFNRLRGPKN